MLYTLEYKIGPPTVKEFLDRYIEELGDNLPMNSKLYNVL
jgi:hypothetical protein